MPDVTSKPSQKELKEETLHMESEGQVRSSDTQEQVITQFIEREQKEHIRSDTQEFQEDLHEADIHGFAPSSQTVAGAQGQAMKSEFLLEIENILADDLGETYANMEPSLRIRFKLKGEEVARKIEEIALVSKAKIKQILNWIKEWLKMVPGVNRFFLEQEAKIKTDKIMGVLNERASARGL